MKNNERRQLQMIYTLSIIIILSSYYDAIISYVTISTLYVAEEQFLSYSFINAS